jgi:hypothetical protein
MNKEAQEKVEGEAIETPRVEFEHVVKAVFMATGTIPAPILFREIAERLWESNPELAGIFEDVVLEANDIVRNTVEEMQEQKIQVASADSIPQGEVQ